MNEKEQQKADKELLKELSGRFIKAYSDHEFKLLLEAQARIIRAEERERAAKIVKTFEWYDDPEYLIDDLVSIILSDNQHNNEQL